MRKCKTIKIIKDADKCVVFDENYATIGNKILIHDDKKYVEIFSNGKLKKKISYENIIWG